MAHGCHSAVARARGDGRRRSCAATRDVDRGGDHRQPRGAAGRALRRDPRRALRRARVRRGRRSRRAPARRRSWRAAAALALAARPPTCAVVEVDDAVAALGALARAHRAALGELRVVAHHRLGRQDDDQGAARRRSALVGAATTRCQDRGQPQQPDRRAADAAPAAPAHRYAVVEMGMSGRGEIEYLTGARAARRRGRRQSPARTSSCSARSRTSRAPRPRSSAGSAPTGGAVCAADDERCSAPHVGAPAQPMTFGPTASRRDGDLRRRAAPGRRRLTMQLRPAAA